jgi:hypothetical protein
VDINGRRWRVQNGGKARRRVGGPSAEDADRSVPETMKHAFMDAAAKRLICCVACANQSTMHLNCCACACMFGHQYVRMYHGNASSGLRKPGHPARAHHHMHTIGIGSLGSMLTPGEFMYVMMANWEDRKGKSRGLTSVLDMNSLGAQGADARAWMTPARVRHGLGSYNAPASSRRAWAWMSYTYLPLPCPVALNSISVC